MAIQVEELRILFKNLEAEGAALLLAQQTLADAIDAKLVARQREHGVIVATLAQAAAESDLEAAKTRLRDARTRFMLLLEQADLKTVALFISAFAMVN